MHAKLCSQKWPTMAPRGRKMTSNGLEWLKVGKVLAVVEGAWPRRPPGGGHPPPGGPPGRVGHPPSSLSSPTQLPILFLFIAVLYTYPHTHVCVCMYVCVLRYTFAIHRNILHQRCTIVRSLIHETLLLLFPPPDAFKSDSRRRWRCPPNLFGLLQLPETPRWCPDRP